MLNLPAFLLLTYSSYIFILVFNVAAAPIPQTSFISTSSSIIEKSQYKTSPVFKRDTVVAPAAGGASLNSGVADPDSSSPDTPIAAGDSFIIAAAVAAGAENTIPESKETDNNKMQQVGHHELKKMIVAAKAKFIKENPSFFS